jgi:hypothetical protein
VSVIAIGFSFLMFIDLGRDPSLKMKRTLEEDWRMLEGTWVLVNPPIGWDRVELRFVRQGETRGFEFTASNAWCSTMHGMMGLKLRELGQRRDITVGVACQYWFHGSQLVLREKTEKRGQVGNGVMKLDVPGLSGTWTKKASP